HRVIVAGLFELLLKLLRDIQHMSKLVGGRRGNGDEMLHRGVPILSWHGRPARGVPVLRDVGTYSARSQIAPASFHAFLTDAIYESAAPMLAGTRVHGRDAHVTFKARSLS